MIRKITLSDECQAEITALAYSSDGTRIACGTNKQEGKKVFVYNCDNYTLITSFEPLGASSIIHLEFNADRTALTTVSNNQIVQKWNLSVDTEFEVGAELAMCEKEKKEISRRL